MPSPSEYSSLSLSSMGFDTMRSFRLLGLNSVSHDHLLAGSWPYADVAEWPARRDSCVSLHATNCESAASRDSLAAPPIRISPPSFRATKAKWSPPVSPRSSASVPASLAAWQADFSRSAHATPSTSEPRPDLASQLFSAACSGDLPGIERLLSRGASVHSSVSVPDLFDSFRPHKPGRLSSLAGAAAHGQHDACELLLRHGAALNPSSEFSANTPLHEAVRRDDVALVHFLLVRGADVDLPNTYASTPLMYAAKYASAEVMELLLACAPDLARTNRFSTAAIHWSVWPGDVDVTELLLRAGADPNHPLADGSSPLSCAVFAGSAPMVDCLLHYGADPLLPNYARETPLYFARTQPDDDGEILHLLQSAIATAPS